VHDQNGTFVHGTNTDVLGMEVPSIATPTTFRFDIAAVHLLDGVYELSIGAHTEDGGILYDQLNQVARFDVLSGSRAAGVVALPVRVSVQPTVDDQREAVR